MDFEITRAEPKITLEVTPNELAALAGAIGMIGEVALNDSFTRFLQALPSERVTVGRPQWLDLWRTLKAAHIEASK